VTAVPQSGHRKIKRKGEAVSYHQLKRGRVAWTAEAWKEKAEAAKGRRPDGRKGQTSPRKGERGNTGRGHTPK